jgi:hypothetical protein
VGNSSLSKILRPATAANVSGLYRLQGPSLVAIRDGGRERGHTQWRRSWNFGFFHEPSKHHLRPPSDWRLGHLARYAYNILEHPLWLDQSQLP